MLYEASHDNIEKVSDQAWNHVADTQIKAFLRGFCFDLLSVFVSLFLCCPGCLFLIVLTLKWQCWRGPEASVVLSPFQSVLELTCTDSSVNGEGETFCLSIENLSTWESSRQTDRHLGQQARLIPETVVLKNCPLFSPSQGKRLKICDVLYVLDPQNKMLPIVWVWMLDIILWCVSHSQFSFPGSAPYYLCDGDNEQCSCGMCKGKKNLRNKLLALLSYLVRGSECLVLHRDEAGWWKWMPGLHRVRD